jgi:predicted helicase
MMRLSETLFTQLTPDAKGNWLLSADNDFQALLPLCSKSAKIERASLAKVVFKLFTQGVKTNRDEWVWGEAQEPLRRKVSALIASYNEQSLSSQEASGRVSAGLRLDLKWTRKLKKALAAGRALHLDPKRFELAAYRPFVKSHLYFCKELNEDWYRLEEAFGYGRPNTVITVTEAGSQKPFMALACDTVFDYHLVGAAAAANSLPRFRYSESGEREENITDWSLDQFRKHYQPGRGKKDRPITKEAIFHYVYGVLHDPVYREKYALNLKREFPRIPFYADFWQWADWGKALMDLHIDYESVAPWGLSRTDVPDEKARRAGLPPKAMLKADKDAGLIRLDSETALAGIPPEAWDYRLGNRSALEWVLDQYKEKTPKDPTIREKFNTYRFADYKEKVIDLLMRVTRVSVETMAITEAMKEAKR